MGGAHVAVFGSNVVQGWALPLGAPATLAFGDTSEIQVTLEAPPGQRRAASGERAARWEGLVEEVNRGFLVRFGFGLGWVGSGLMGAAAFWCCGFVGVGLGGFGRVRGGLGFVLYHLFG